MDQNPEQNFISLADASKQTGYHQDYLGFLCRNGKLKGLKIGRNWVTTKTDLAEFIANYKNGINEVIDETGTKIQVHVKSDKSENQTPDSALPVILAQPSIVGHMSNQEAYKSEVQTPSLLHLKKEVLEGLENRIITLGSSVEKIEHTIENQAESLGKQKELEEELARAHKKISEEKLGPVIVPAIIPLNSREELHGKFASNFSLGGQASGLSGQPQNQQAGFFSKNNIAKLHKSFSKPERSNVPAIAAAALIALVGLIGSFVYFSFLPSRSGETKIFYSQSGSGNQFATSTNPGGQIVVNRNDSTTINQILGLNQAQVFSLIDNRLNQYLAEGKFKGDPGIQGPQGPAGSGGGSFTGSPAAPIGILNPNPQTGFGGGTLLGVTTFGADTASINNLTVNNLTVTGLTSGNCVQAGANGTLTTTSLPCGSGSGGGGNSTTTINGLSSADFTFATTSDTNITLSISTSTNTITFNPGWTGTLAVGRGGTGAADFTAGDVLFGNGSGALATSSNFTFNSTTNVLTVTNASTSALTVSGPLVVTGPVTFTSATTSINGVTMYWPTANPTGAKVLQNDGAGNLTWVTDSTGGGGSVSGGLVGYVTSWASSTGITYGTLIDNGTVAGYRATSSTIAFNIQGAAGSNDIFNVSSSTGISVLRVTANQRVGIGSTTPTATLVVQGTSTQPTLSIFAVASSSNNQILTVTAGGNVGVNTSSPVNAFSVNGKSLFTGHMAIGANASVNQDYFGASNATVLNLRETVTDMSPNYVEGILNILTLNPSANATSSVYGFDNEVYTQDTNTRNFGIIGAGYNLLEDDASSTLSEADGVINIVKNNTATGTITTVYTNYNRIFNALPGGTIGTGYGVYVDSAINNGTFTNNYGLYINDQSSVGSTNSYNLYSAGATAKNYFQGFVGIGSSTPSMMLSVQGTAGANDILNIASSTGVSVLRVTANQRVGIGSTSPNATLVVQGTSTFPTIDVLRIASSTGAVIFDVLANGNVGVGTSTPGRTLTVAGDIRATGILYDSTNAAGTSGNFLMSTATGYQWTATSSLFGGTQVTGSGASGKVTRWTDVNTISTGILLDNGTVAGINATSSTITFSLQGIAAAPGGSNDLFDVSSSTGISILRVTANQRVGIGSTTPNATLVVEGTSTSPTLDVFRVASSTHSVLFDVLANGNVGINTSTPGRTLTVAGDIRATGILYDSSNAAGSSGNFLMSTATGYQWTATSSLFGGSQITGTGASGKVTRWTDVNTVSTGILFDNGTVAGINATSSTITFNLQGTAGSNDIFDVSSSTGISVLRVTANQRIGIGSTTPNATLVVEGTSTSPTLDVFRVASSTHSVLFDVLANGNVGIGTTTPGRTLTVVGDIRATGILYDSTNSAGTSGNFLMSTATGYQWTSTSTLFGGSQVTGSGASGKVTRWTDVNTISTGILFDNGTVAGVNATSSTITFNLQGTAGANDIFDVSSSTGISVLRVTNNQRVGIGSTTPNATLVVEGTSTSPTLDVFRVASSTHSVLFDVLANGNVGINTSTPGRTLTVVGDIRATGILYDSTNSAGTSGNFLMSTATGYQWTATSSLFGGSQVTGSGANGKVARWTDANTLSTGILFDNGTVTGINATSSTITFNLQGTAGSNDIFDVASSTGISVLRVTANQRVGIGSTTPNATLTVEGTSTSPTLDIFAVASSTHQIFLNVTSGGNVGVGTSTPIAQLHVYGAPSYAMAGTASTTLLFGDVSASGTPTTLFGSQIRVGDLLIGPDFQSRIVTAATGTTLLLNAPFSPAYTTATSFTFQQPLLRLVDSLGNTGVTVNANGNITADQATFGQFMFPQDAGLVTWADMVVSSTPGNVPVGYTASLNGNQILGIYGISDGVGGLTNLGVGIGTSSPMAALQVTGFALNQTGGTGAATTTRALYVFPNPGDAPNTLQVADFRAFEVAPYVWRLASSTYLSNAYGSVFNAYTISTSSAATITNASNLVITGAPIASSTNVVLSTSTALTIQGGSVVSSSGVVTKAYSLFVQAPSGATNNYAAAFVGGNVGIGSTTPNALLTLQGASGATTDLFNVTSSTNASLLIVQSSGKVGIGTSSPSALFTIQGTAGQTSGVVNVASSSGASFFTLDANGFGTFQPTSTSTTAYLFNNAGGLAQMSLDTTNGRLQVGSGAGTANPVLVVLDAKNTAGDPAGVNGAMYYNSNLNKMRCYVNSTWTDCGSRSKNINILNASVLPDASGNVYFEPFTIVASSAPASTPFFKHGNFSFLDTATKDCLYGLAQLPKDLATSTTPNFSPIWTASSTSGNIVWEIAYRDVAGDDASVLNSSTAQITASTTDAAPTAIFNRMAPTINASTTVLGKGDTLEFRLCRDGTDSNDTLAATATLQSLLFNYDN